MSFQSSTGLAHLSQSKPSSCSAHSPQSPPRIIQLVIWSPISFSMVATSIPYFIKRSKHRRLRLKSALPVVFGSLGGAAFIMSRAVYDYQGREYLSCTDSTVLLYIFFP